MDNLVSQDIDTVSAGSGRSTVGDTARDHVRCRPNEPATVCGEHRHTYAELDARANRFAAWLTSHGVGPGDRVLWLGQNCHRILEGILAAGKIGAVFCPANWRGSPSEYAFVLDDLKPAVVVWQEAEIGDKVREVRRDSAADIVWLQHDGQGPGTYEDEIRDSSPEDVFGAVDPNAPVLLLYTAAWDGRPNGALIPHRAIAAHDMMWAWLSGIDPDYVYLVCSPLFHVAAMYPMLATFQMGGTNVILPRATPAEICAAIQRERCNGGFIIEPTISQILELEDIDLYDLHSLRVPGSAKPEWLKRASLDESLWAQGPTGYGQTECMGLLTCTGLGGTGAHGRTVPGLQVRLVNPEGRDVPTGETGEFAARGPQVMVGYHNRPELNAQRFQNGWYRTGDLGRREPDGSLAFVGPKARMVKSGAENIYVAEVEACIRQHPEVAEVAIIGIPDGEWGQTVKAIIVRAPGSAVTGEDIVEFCRANMASYKKPSSVQFRDEPLPRRGFTADYDVLDEQYGGGGYPGSELFRKNSRI
jgi:long-chain acyl-CoA synthetase